MYSVSMAYVINNINNINIIDIRPENIYKVGHISNAKNIPKNDLLVNYPNYLEKNRTYYIYCDRGITSSLVVNFLNSKGYDTLNIEGGYYRYLLMNK